MCFHDGVGASAFVERQMPPPAAATYSVHSCCLHFGSTAIAVTRPDHWVGLMKDCVPSLSTLSVSGPSESHLESSFGDFAFTFASALIAPSTSPIVTSSAGYARSVYASAPPSPSPSPCSSCSRSCNASCANRPAFAQAEGDSSSRDEPTSRTTAASAPPITTTAATQRMDLRMPETPFRNRIGGHSEHI